MVIWWLWSFDERLVGGMDLMRTLCVVLRSTVLRRWSVSRRVGYLRWRDADILIAVQNGV